MPHSLLKRLEKALLRDDPSASQLAPQVPVEEVFPLLSKYSKPIHPYETRERAFECLCVREEWQSSAILASFLDDHPANTDFRLRASRVLAHRENPKLIDDFLKVLSQDMNRLNESAPLIHALGRDERPGVSSALEGMREDLERLLKMVNHALLK